MTLDQLQSQFEAFKAKKLALDMSRGKPSAAQLDLSNELLDVVTSKDYLSVLWKVPSPNEDSFNLHFQLDELNDNPEGYYLVGYPNEWKNVDRQQISEYQYSAQLRSTIAYLPITKIEYKNKTQDKYSLDDPDAFYGKIMDYIGNDGPQPLNIEGMSGGPLFSVERDYKTAEIKIRLAGIQRGWKKSDRIIVVEPIQRIAAYLEEEFSLESS